MSAELIAKGRSAVFLSQAETLQLCPQLADALEKSEAGWREASGAATILTRIAEENRMRAEKAEAVLKVAIDALKAEERHQWALRNLAAVQLLDDRRAGLKMEVERTCSEANILRKAALAQLPEPPKEEPAKYKSSDDIRRHGPANTQD